MATNRTTSAGVVTSVLASVLFGAIFFVSGAIEAQASTLVAWRILLTAGCYALLLSFPAGRRAFKAFWEVLRKGPLYVFYFVILVALIALQLWLFAWAPKGHALDASLGYLLLPIFLVVVGRFFFSSIVSRLQWIAVGIAIVAVAIKFIISAQMSWVAFAIAVGYALYFALRSYSGFNSFFCYGAETIVLSPIAIALLFAIPDVLDMDIMIMVICAGLAGAVAMALYLAASVLLSMPIFGLLSYGEPILLFIAALMLGESLDMSDALVYSLLGFALAILGFDGIWRSRKTLEPTLTV